MTRKKVLIIVICVIVLIVMGFLVKKVSTKMKYDSYLKAIKENEAIEEEEKLAQKEREKATEEKREQEIKSMIDSGKKDFVYKDDMGMDYKVTINDNDEISVEPYISDSEEDINEIPKQKGIKDLPKETDISGF